MKTLWKILRFLVILETAFVIHEYGHFREMRKRNISVAEFSLGIGPRIAGLEVDGVALSLRLIPFMTYVAPTEEGGKRWVKEPLIDRVIISGAGVLNNCIAGLIGVCLLHCVSGRKSRQPLLSIMKNVIYTPMQFAIAGSQYLLNFVTFGFVSAGTPKSFIFDETRAPLFIQFVELNLLLALWNILPIIPLDGGRIFNDLAPLVASSGFLFWWNKIGIYFLFALFFFGGTKTRIIKRNSEKD